MKVPRQALQTVDTIPRLITKATKDGPVHGKLALSQCLDKTPSTNPWRAVLPTMLDFYETMPFLWDHSLQDLLPPASKKLLMNQQRKYGFDWAIASEAFPALNEEEYRYNWLIVNTRTFYWVAPGAKRPSVRDDCMALAPFADYFNHADTGCKVNFGEEGITVTADRVYEEGDEVYISYGPHSNDFLLAEYGFILNENKWDELQLDQVILPELSAKQQKLLEEEGFLGNYVLDQDTICYRTHVALMLLCVSLKKWRLFLSGEDDGEGDQHKVDEILVKLLRRFLKHTNEAILNVASISEGLKSQRETLERRWTQIYHLLSLSIKRMHTI